MLTFDSTSARKSLYQLIQQVNEDNTPIEITDSKNDNGAVLISKRAWDAIQETLYLQRTGTLHRMKHFENEETEDLKDIDWNTL
ncbi:type II toxin-antitoxin system Phd/YefM family antitoxin [Oceanobacillus neutriphilus]|uniref:Antitoxin n=1 Tax=Oceanobacillus neutriphilus TaxID=531815 RepID=A0ABQ2NS15_9BACI|nr:type II toxin-antitoxin system prevent-host-death family antitoxin [Oceanobacillus neutriphilus]GGP08613.1 antitoxin [Oceanobacillus neutriphilus]